MSDEGRRSLPNQRRDAIWEHHHARLERLEKDVENIKGELGANRAANSETRGQRKLVIGFLVLVAGFTSFLVAAITIARAIIHGL